MAILETLRAPLKRDRLLISLHNPDANAGRGAGSRYTENAESKPATSMISPKPIR